MNKKYVIVTDSCCDLSQEMIDQLGIKIVPLKFSFKNESYYNYPDERQMKCVDFYERLRNKEVSITTQPSPNDFVEAFNEELLDGKEILSISFSSALSGTFNSACVARDLILESNKDAKIICVDSLCASMGQGLLIYYAVQLLNEGKSIEEVAQWIEDNKLKIAHWFTVGDLGTLKRGGRLSATKAFLGDLLGLKPVLHVSDEGKLIPIVKARGRKKALLQLIENCKRTIDDPVNQVIFISHGDCLEDAKLVGEALKRNLNVKEIVYNFIGPVIGSHAGPGTIALFFKATTRN